MLPADSVTAIIIKFLYSLNLVCSYPIVIYPANQAVENWFCSCLKKKRYSRLQTDTEDEMDDPAQEESISRENKTLYWMQNFSRVCVTVGAIICGIVLASKIDKFLGLVGALLCAPLALTFPAMLHLKLLAKTRM